MTGLIFPALLSLDLQAAKATRACDSSGVSGQRRTRDDIAV
jgi:hypothetical protein